MKLRQAEDVTHPEGPEAGVQNPNPDGWPCHYMTFRSRKPFPLQTTIVPRMDAVIHFRKKMCCNHYVGPVYITIRMQQRPPASDNFPPLILVEGCTVIHKTLHT